MYARTSQTRCAFRGAPASRNYGIIGNEVAESPLLKRQAVARDEFFSSAVARAPWLVYGVITSMRASRDYLSCWAIGEAWKRPFIERTLFSLQRCGLNAEATDHWAIPAQHPLTYPELVRDALERTGPERYSLIVPAGMIAASGFPRALDRCLETVCPGNAHQLQISGLADIPNGPLLAQGIAPGQPTCISFKADGLNEHLVARFPGAFESALPIRSDSYVIPRYIVRLGRDTFQELAKDEERLSFERPLEQFRAEALRTLTRGRVFRCNTEEIYESLSEAHGADTLVAVASGIKPWYLANELRSSLKQLILIDKSLAQIHFAFDAFESIGEAESWSEICRLPAYTSLATDDSLPRHDYLYEAVCADRSEWRFETVFLRCDLLAQTFHLVEFIKKYPTRKLVFWYSNIFHPFFGQRFSEIHHQLETSFVRLMQREFPGILLYSSGREPAPIMDELLAGGPECQGHCPIGFHDE